jgi:hypothetical protein
VPRISPPRACFPRRRPTFPRVHAGYHPTRPLLSRRERRSLRRGTRSHACVWYPSLRTPPGRAHSSCEARVVCVSAPMISSADSASLLLLLTDYPVARVSPHPPVSRGAGLIPADCRQQQQLQLLTSADSLRRRRAGGRAGGRACLNSTLPSCLVVSLSPPRVWRRGGGGVPLACCDRWIHAGHRSMPSPSLGVAVARCRTGHLEAGRTIWPVVRARAVRTLALTTRRRTKPGPGQRPEAAGGG